MPPIGLGCINLSHAYGVPPTRAQGEAVLQRALDLGITHFDTAALYGFGRNEHLEDNLGAAERADFTAVAPIGAVSKASVSAGRYHADGVILQCNDRIP